MQTNCRNSAMSISLHELSGTGQSLPVSGACKGFLPGLDLADPNLPLQVHTRTETALSAWADLEAIAPASFYQTRRFLIPWVETVGAARGITPFLITLHDGAGMPLALLPLGMRQSGGLRILEFLGGKDSNANMGLFRPGLQINATGMHLLFRRARHMVDSKPDVAILLNQPLEWGGKSNPLALLDNRLSPSMCHACHLTASGDDYRNANLSRDYRKKLRSKQRKLAELGDLKFVQADSPEQATGILQAFYTQKLKRFDDQNIKSEFDTPETRQFMTRAATAHHADGSPGLELFALTCGDKIVATFGGGTHQDCFYGLFNSFEADPAYSRHSPGDILLSHLIDETCHQGLTRLDLGMGESRYKDIWCNLSTPMCDTVIGFSPRGHAMAALVAVRQTLKRRVKQSKWAWPLAMKLRAKLPL
jgi:CelD/BcsL family acetyltransferase involved in cellulose biosynthesis